MAQVQNATTASGVLPQPPSADSLKPSLQETEDRFLTLLITQMRNQDPLNPLDNAQVTTQLAQLNTVSGINRLNDTLTALAASFNQTQVLQASSMIGRGVLIEGSDVQLGSSGALFGVSLAQPVDRLVVTITDAAGNVLHRADAGPQQSGIIALQWDGAVDSGGNAPAGRYRFTVSATAAGKAADATPLTTGTVTGVTTGADGVQLNLQGAGSVPLSRVKQII